MKIGVRVHDFGKSNAKFLARQAKEVGFDAVQFVINKAIELLETTNLNISEIARMLGFDDSLYFSRVFKKETGTSPKKYIKPWL